MFARLEILNVVADVGDHRIQVLHRLREFRRLDRLGGAQQFQVHANRVERLDHAVVQFHADAVAFFQQGDPALVLAQFHPGDGERGIARNRLDQPLILLVERLPIDAIRQVQHPKQVIAGQDRHAEEALHVRVVRRKADRAWVVLHSFQPDWFALLHDRAEQAAPMRQMPDHVGGVRFHARELEVFQPAAPIWDAERGITRADQFARGVGEAFQHFAERVRAGGIDDGRGNSF